MNVANRCHSGKHHFAHVRRHRPPPKWETAVSALTSDGGLSTPKLLIDNLSISLPPLWLEKFQAVNILSPYYPHYPIERAAYAGAPGGEL